MIDKRPRDSGTANWRRRRCISPKCAYRFSTLEFETVKRVAYVPRFRAPKP